MTLWNPVIQPVTHLVRVPVRTDYTIHDPTGQAVFTEVSGNKIALLRSLPSDFSFFLFLNQHSVFLVELV